MRMGKSGHRSERPRRDNPKRRTVLRRIPAPRHDLKLTVESGDNVAIEVRWVATHESGGHVEVPFAAIMQLRSGLINAVRVYLDTAALMAQLEPAPASA